MSEYVTESMNEWIIWSPSLVLKKIKIAKATNTFESLLLVRALDAMALKKHSIFCNRLSALIGFSWVPQGLHAACYIP